MKNTDDSVEFLNAALGAKIQRHFGSFDTNPDVLSQLLADKRSESTRNAYKRDINYFFIEMTGSVASSDSVLEFLHLEERQAVTVILKYKAKLINKGLKEATVNRRLAALKSLVAMGRQLGVCAYSLNDIKAEKNQTYRDTTGVSKEAIAQILLQCNQDTLKGKRDYALLRLLWDNALRRNEIAQADIADFNPGSRTLIIRGKGQGTQTQTIKLTTSATTALTVWLEARGEMQGDAPLFCAVDNVHKGHRLTGEAMRYVVDKLSQKAGITKKMSPHRIRHSAITAALDATDGNLRKVQKLSRHAKIDTLLIYDDNRSNDQQELSDLLGDMV